MTSRWSTKIGRPALALALSVLGAFARPACADKEGDFRHHYERGLALYSDERYTEAIREFQDAYAIRARPRLLFNLGQAHRNQGNAKEALRFFLLYQAMEPDPKPGLKAELERYISELQGQIDTADRARRAEEGTGPVIPEPPPGPAPRLPLVPVPGGDDALVLRQRAEAPAQTPVYKRWWFWTAIGGAAAVVVITGAAAGAAEAGRFKGDTRHPQF